jgi:hypothetical protein
MSLTPIGEVIAQVVSQAFKPNEAVLMSFEEVEQLSPSEQMDWYSAKVTYEVQKTEAFQAANQQSKTYKCRYCLDQRFVFVLPVWVGFGVMPNEFTQEQLQMVQHARTYNIAIPCKCHPTNPNAFYNRFGEPLENSLYGRWLVHYRKEIAKQRSQEDFGA